MVERTSPFERKSGDASFFDPGQRYVLSSAGESSDTAVGTAALPVTKQLLSDAVIELRQLISTVKSRHVASGALLSPRFLEQVNGPLFVVSHARAEIASTVSNDPDLRSAIAGADVLLYRAGASPEDDPSTAKLAFTDRHVKSMGLTPLALDAAGRRSARDLFVEEALGMPVHFAEPQDIDEMRALFNSEHLKGRPTGWSYSLLSLIEHAASKADGFAPTDVSLAMCRLGEPIVFQDLVQDIRRAMPSVDNIQAVGGPFHVERGKGFATATGTRDVPVVQSIKGGATQTVAILRSAKGAGGRALEGGSFDDAPVDLP
jgi:hypothetical protein